MQRVSSILILYLLDLESVNKKILQQFKNAANNDVSILISDDGHVYRLHTSIF